MCNDLRMEIVLRVIDYFLLDGWKVLFGVILALLKLSERILYICQIGNIIHMGFEKAFIYLKSFLKENIIDEVRCGCKGLV
jgi:hypothetical protein